MYVIFHIFTIKLALFTAFVIKTKGETTQEKFKRKSNSKWENKRKCIYKANFWFWQSSSKTGKKQRAKFSTHANVTTHRHSHTHFLAYRSDSPSAINSVMSKFRSKFVPSSSALILGEKDELETHQTTNKSLLKEQNPPLPYLYY